MVPISIMMVETLDKLCTLLPKAERQLTDVQQGNISWFVAFIFLLSFHCYYGHCTI